MTRPKALDTEEMIQKRMVTWDSGQPSACR